MTSFGERIKIFREAKGWSQAELARRANVGDSNISAMERRPTYRPKARTILKLAKALDVETSDLLPPLDSPSFGQRIRQMRLERGWSVKELAKKLKVKERAIHLREQRTNKPEYITVLGFAYIFKVDPSELCDE